jgi:hypothetical protein
MAGERIKWDGAIPMIAASAINDRQAVQLTASALERQVLPIATVNVEPYGIAMASAGAAGASTNPQLTPACPVIDDGNIVKVTAAASLGVGADIVVGSTNGGFAPASAGASGILMWRVGKSLSAANAGEVFSLHVKPRQISGAQT